MVFKAGDLIGGRFHVQKILGDGGVGIVYLVDDKELNQSVALKVLKPELTQNKVATERFIREVKTVREVEHGGIVPVYQTGRLGKQLFYTMEWIRGESIRQILQRETKVNPNRAIGIVSALCDILEKVHKVAVHRDIGAENVMVEEDGSVRLLDFGTARLMGSETRLTQVSLHVGKLVYSAPEQRANARDVDHRADLYSVGVLLYEMLTGELGIRFAPVTDHCPELPRMYNDFFTKALADDPGKRFQSAAEFKWALTALPVPE